MSAVEERTVSRHAIEKARKRFCESTGRSEEQFTLLFEQFKANRPYSEIGEMIGITRAGVAYLKKVHFRQLLPGLPADRELIKLRPHKPPRRRPESRVLSTAARSFAESAKQRGLNIVRIRFNELMVGGTHCLVYHRRSFNWIRCEGGKKRKFFQFTVVGRRVRSCQFVLFSTDKPRYRMIVPAEQLLQAYANGRDHFVVAIPSNGRTVRSRFYGIKLDLFQFRDRWDQLIDASKRSGAA